MNKKLTFLSLAALFVILLAACSPSAQTSGSTITEVNNSSSAVAANATSVVRLNLNTASGDDFLAAIPGLGNRMVREFMEYRPYISIRQFRQEIGKYVDDAQVAEYEKYVYVPIDINDSDSETLQQISGLSADEAASLMSARPFASTDDFLTKLSEYVSAEELEIAKAYVGENQ
jgi:DNA uptake protein ComE-like DNA-binding protein